MGQELTWGLSYSGGARTVYPPGVKFGQLVTPSAKAKIKLNNYRPLEVNITIRESKENTQNVAVTAAQMKRILAFMWGNIQVHASLQILTQAETQMLVRSNDNWTGRIKLKN